MYKAPPVLALLLSKAVVEFPSNVMAEVSSMYTAPPSPAQLLTNITVEFPSNVV